MSNKRGTEYEVPQGIEPKVVYPNKKYNVSKSEMLTYFSRRGLSSLPIGTNTSPRHGMSAVIGVSKTSTGYMGASSLKVSSKQEPIVSRDMTISGKLWKGSRNTIERQNLFEEMSSRNKVISE